jgi:hypothetical protein
MADVRACMQWAHYYYRPDATGELVGTPGGNAGAQNVVSLLATTARQVLPLCAAIGTAPATAQAPLSHGWVVARLGRFANTVC